MPIRIQNDLPVKEILENENLRDDVFDILEGSIIFDLELILEKIKHFKRTSEIDANRD